MKDLKEQIVSFFNTCLVAPESFDLNNEKISEVLDNESGDMMGVNQQQEMLMAMLGGAGMPGMMG